MVKNYAQNFKFGLFLNNLVSDVNMDFIPSPLLVENNKAVFFWGKTEARCF